MSYVPPEPPVKTWVKDRHGATHYRTPKGWAPAPTGFYPAGIWKAMWKARGPLVDCGPWGAPLEIPIGVTAGGLEVTRRRTVFDDMPTTCHECGSTDLALGYRPRNPMGYKPAVVVDVWLGCTSCSETLWSSTLDALWPELNLARRNNTQGRNR